MISKKLKLKLILLSGSLLFCAIFAEIAVRIVIPQDLSGVWRVATESGLKVNKSSGSARHQNGERVVHYSFSEPHLRDTQLDPKRKTILCLGDSFTFGWLLNKEDTYVALLQKYADQAFPDKYNFINAACGGWGTADYLAYLEEFGDQVKPDYVLIFIGTDDIGRAFKKGFYEFKQDELVKVVKPQSMPKKVINAIPGYQFLCEHSQLFQLIRKVALITLTELPAESSSHTAYWGPSSPNLEVSRNESIKLGQALFKRIKSWCETNNTKLLVATNGWMRLDHINKNSDEPTRAFMSEAKEFFKSQNVTYKDISAEVLEVRGKDHKKFIIPQDCHPNKAGAKLIAEKAWDSFLKQQLDPRIPPINTD